MKDSMRILIAEADVGIAEQLKNHLSSFGHEVLQVVSTGEALMENVKLLNPSLIITDINLNGQLDGIEAIARLESKYKIPYIFLTAYDDYSRLITSYYLNPVSIITKPINQTNLRDSIWKASFDLQPV
jgi:two-component SAPR family response regulator